MKQFTDIQNVKTDENTSGFNPGDFIEITEKIDGVNASVAFDRETGKLTAFSKKRELSAGKTLRGFWNFVQNVNENSCLFQLIKNNPSFVLFGEWDIDNNKIKDYNVKYRKQWIVYDIWDSDRKCWLDHSAVRAFCNQAGIPYIHVLYIGPFISWDHCKSFLHANTYGPTQEGIVIKNEDRIFENKNDELVPSVLQIINPEFIKDVSGQSQKSFGDEPEIV